MQIRKCDLWIHTSAAKQKNTNGKDSHQLQVTPEQEGERKKKRNI